MKTGTKVFQHFLLKSNLTQIMDDGPFTILIPADNAFQRWHPIDWGFYPFSVPEFTESILRNHFIQSQNPLRMNDVKNANKLPMKTLGGETVIFRNARELACLFYDDILKTILWFLAFPNVNNVSILADYTLSNGNQVFIISEVLFVTEAVVSKLHQVCDFWIESFLMSMFWTFFRCIKIKRLHHFWHSLGSEHSFCLILSWLWKGMPDSSKSPGL